MSTSIGEPSIRGRVQTPAAANVFALGDVRVGRDEPEGVAETGRALDERRAPVQRHRHQQVEVESAPVVRGQHAAGPVDRARVELRDELDSLLVEQRAELF